MGTLHVGGRTIINGLFTLESGVVLSGPTDVEITSVGNLVVDNTLVRNVIVAGQVGGVGTIDGNVALNSGSAYSAGPLQVTGDLAVTGSSHITGGVVSLGGTATIGTDSTLTIEAGASLNGAGAINLDGAGALAAGSAGEPAAGGGAPLPPGLVVNGETDKDVVAQLGQLDGNGVISGNVMLEDSLLRSASAGTLQIDGNVTVMGTSTIGDAGSNVEVNGDTHIPANQSLIIGEDAVFGGSGPLVPDADSTLINMGTVNKAPQLPAGTLNIEGEFPGLSVPDITIARVGPFGIFRMPIVRIDGALEIAVRDGGGNSAPANIDLGKTTLPGSLAIDTTSDVTADDLILDGGFILTNPGGGGLNSNRVTGTGSLAIQTDTGALFPGASPGQLTFSNSGDDALTISLEDTTGQQDPDPTFQFEINDATGQMGANPGWDGVVVSDGGVTFDTTDSFEFVIEVLSLGSTTWRERSPTSILRNPTRGDFLTRPTVSLARRWSRFNSWSTTCSSSRSTSFRRVASAWFKTRRPVWPCNMTFLASTSPPILTLTATSTRTISPTRSTVGRPATAWTSAGLTSWHGNDNWVAVSNRSRRRRRYPNHRFGCWQFSHRLACEDSPGCNQSS